MKITVGDVMNARSDVRDYLSVSEENGRIYVKLEAMDVVLIDKTNEWEEALKKSEELLQKNETQLDEANQEIRRLRKALEFYADGKTYTDKQHTSSGELVGTGYLNILSDNGETARQVLKGGSD